MEDLVKIEDYSIEYRTGGAVAKAVNGLNITIHKGEALGLVGESGAGKTTTSLAILKLLPEKIAYNTSGEIYYKGKPMSKMNEKEMTKVRGKEIAMVFQNPLSSLNPVFTVGQQIALAIQTHDSSLSKKEAMKKAGDLLETVGIARYRLDDYPHQFSGGMRQRVGIAAALACSPELLICDEPTTALDVTIQAQILELMKDLQTKYDTSLLMITHNLGIIAELCQNVAIMYAGEVVEYGSVREVFEHPAHWYTIGLLHAIPSITGTKDRLESIPGAVANAQKLPEGCRFNPRCAQCQEICKKERPAMIKINDNHYVACCNWRK